MFKYKTTGTCSREIYIDIDDNDIITDVRIIGGCAGNTQGLAKLCLGQNAHKVAESLKGIQCQGNTSCPDQLANAIYMFYDKRK